MTLRNGGELLRRASRYDLAAAGATFGTQVDQVIAGLDDVEIVFDHNHRVALVDQPAEHGQEPANVLEVKARRWFIEDVHRVTGRTFSELRCELDPLSFSA